jgi:ABC-type branched-subunit amino acid transport system substrate-binding protein
MKQHLDATAGSGGRRANVVRAVSAVVATLLVVALSACGSSGNETKGGGTLTLMTWAPEATQLTNYPAIIETAKVWGKYINAKGGVDGHKVNILTCDEGGDPTKATNCAREAIQKKVVAVVGSFGYTGDATLPLLKGAHIAWFGGCCSNTPAENTSDNSFLLGDGPAWAAADADRAAADGAKKIAFVGCDGCQTYLPPMENALKARGMKFHREVTIPAQATDYSPQAAQALADGTDAVILVAGEDQDKAFMTAYRQLGSTAKIYGPQGNLTEEVAKSFPKELEGAVTGNSYADLSDPVWDDYRASLAKYDAPTDINYNTLAGLGTWAAYTAFADVVSGMKGPITSATFMKAARSDSSVDTGGMTATVDFTHLWTDGPKGYLNLVNRSASFSHFHDGKLVPDPGGFKDYTNAMLGSPSTP